MYTLIDLEKAKEICSQIQNVHEKIQALSAISNILVKSNREEANSLWTTILEISSHVSNANTFEFYYGLLEVARQKAEIDKIEAKQFLEDKLRVLNHFTRRGLFIHALKHGQLGLNGTMKTEHFKLLVDTYVKIDPIEAEEWVKTFREDLPSIYLPAFLLGLSGGL
ncbi:MAG: hypothetical protein HWD61_15750 [Parachlamydiaceae bacterium]|nr:MAG: hypothetical protein HWD61_15750 [Parachlamydiaceae bacterium]